MRVRVYGLIAYKSREQISYIDAEYVNTFGDDRDLPSEEAILSPNFTRDLMARIAREESRVETKETVLGWLILTQGKLALAVSAVLIILAFVLLER